MQQPNQLTTSNYYVVLFNIFQLNIEIPTRVNAFVSLHMQFISNNQIDLECLKFLTIILIFLQHFETPTLTLHPQNIRRYLFTKSAAPQNAQVAL